MSRDKLRLPSNQGTPVPESAPLKSTGEDVALSLDLLKLVYRHDKDPASLMKRVHDLKRLMLAPES